MQNTKKVRIFALAFETSGKHGDPLAQLVEHNTFNVGVLGSSPKRITWIPTESLCDPMRVTKERNFKLKERGLLHNVKSSFRV